MKYDDMTREQLIEELNKLHKGVRAKNLNNNLAKIVKERTEQLDKEISMRKQVEQSLRESEARFQVALKDSPVVVFNQDRNLHYSFIDNSLLNIPAKDAISKGEADFFSFEDAAFLETIKRQVIQSGVGIQKEVKVTTIEGVTKYFDLKIEPTYDNNEKINGITGAALDITMLKRK